MGSCETGICSNGGGGYVLQFSKLREFLSISPHLVRFVQTLPPPWEVFSISWDLQTKMINKPNFYNVFWRNQVSPGFLVTFKMVRVSPHFSSSHGIPQDSEMFSWRGCVWSAIFELVRTSPHFSSSRGIPIEGVGGDERPHEISCQYMQWCP